MFIALLFTLISVVGTLITSVQTLLTVLFRRRNRPFAGGLHEQATTASATYPRLFQNTRQISRPDASFVSILKPVCGLDDELEQNLESFTRLSGLAFELIISIEDENDPAIPLVERVRAVHPEAPIRLVIGSANLAVRDGVDAATVNRKVDRLIAASHIARGNVFLISDSNVRVEPDDIARTLPALADPAVGCVSNLFVGAGARTLGATLESLHLLSFVVTGNVLAAAANVPCIVGKSMMITRRALEAIGGFEAFRHVLAEDQAIALAVTRSGFRVALSPVVVRNVVIERSVRRALDRQVRWNKIRYSFSRATYLAEFALNPLPWALVVAVTMSPLVLAGVLVARYAQIALLSHATGARLTLRQIAITPLLDLLMFYGQFVPFFSNEVTWRGHRAKIGRNTELIALADAA